jgi:hypothetical protein
MKSRMRLVMSFVLSSVFACSRATPKQPPVIDAGPEVPSLASSSILVKGVGATNTDCRTGVCAHNEDTDLVRWNGAIFLVHRTAESQVLGPNSSLRIYRSTDEGASFSLVATIPAPAAQTVDDGGLADAGLDLGDGGFEAPSGRDLRDPAFYLVGGSLYVKALTRLPVTLLRDTGVNTIATESHTDDGQTWTSLRPIGPAGWSFWRIKSQGGVYYSAAYHDGDDSVALFSSSDGISWAKNADVFTDGSTTPSETELTFMPSGKLMALVRTDGNDDQLLGDAQLMTQVCWSDAPYSSFRCDAPLTGVRLDGPLSFFREGRLFVVARKHLGSSDKKRTALYEVTGNFEGGPIGIQEWFEFPSAGDTAYAGGVALDGGSELISWYSSDVPGDEPWVLGLLDASDIWTGSVQFQSP